MNTKPKRTRPKHGKGWLPIETAPKDGSTILLSRIYHRTVFTGRWSSQCECFVSKRDDLMFDAKNPPTHWQFPPMPPRDWHTYPIPSTYADYLKRKQKSKS